MHYPSIINGEHVSDGIELSVVNPATETAFATCAAATPEQVDQAVAAAKAAFPLWRQRSIEERKTILGKIAEITKQHIEELATLLSKEQGKPLADAMFEIGAAAAFFEYHANVPSTELEPAEVPGSDAKLIRSPLGVVAAIVPWNFPIALLAFKLPSALLAGNTIVIKPAPTTPLTTLRLVALMNEVVPKGVINAIADNGEVGPQLTAHPDVRKISFTGSTNTGRLVMKSAADSLKRVTLELGGNDPAIVLADADLDNVAAPIFEAGFMNNGQTCAAVKRVYVHSSQYDELVSKLAELADAAKIGDAFTPDIKFGPLQNKAQYDLVKKLLEDAINSGATVAAGGEVPKGPGYFVRPTILSNVKDGQRIVDEEQFGPVLPIVKYDNIDDVIDTVNASPFGLGASVWGTDQDAVMNIATRIDTGSVWMNKHFPVAPNVPFGGARQSGIGAELGAQGLLEFTQLKVLA